MVKTLLSTHADTYTHAHKRTRTNTPQQIYCWQLRVQYHSMNTVRMQFYRYIEHTCIRTHTPTSLGTLGSPDYTPTWYMRAFRARGRFRWFEAGRHCFQTIILLRIEHCSLY